MYIEPFCTDSDVSDYFIDTIKASQWIPFYYKYFTSFEFYTPNITGVFFHWNPMDYRGVVVPVSDCSLEVWEFELQSFYHIHFRMNTLGKDLKPLVPSAKE